MIILKRMNLAMPAEGSYQKLGQCSILYLIIIIASILLNAHYVQCCCISINLLLTLVNLVEEDGQHLSLESSGFIDLGDLLS